MKKTILIILGLAASFCCGFYLKTIISKNSETVTPKNLSDSVTTIKKVTGIGGVFFKCKDPDKVKEWYKTHLGLNTDQYGARFEWYESAADTTKKGSTQWSTFNETDTYFNPSTKDFMINYIVENLSGLVEQLKKEGVTIIDTIETYEYGKFIHIMDIEGNKIELYEPSYN